MYSPVRSLLKGLAVTHPWGGHAGPRRVDDEDGAAAAHGRGYVATVLQVLAVFRFFSFALGAGLIFSLNMPEQLPIKLVALLGVVGLYNMARVTLRFKPEAYSRVVNWLILGSDVLLAITLVLMTDGLESGFLVYSLAPILTASLLMDARSALVAAGVTGLSISGAYGFHGLGIGDFPWMLEGNYLVFSLLYVAVCLLIAYLPFLANLNWHARLRHESTIAERRRLRRDVHDNVAQTLAFLSLKVRRAEEKASSTRGAITPRDVEEIRSMVERAYLAVRDYLDDTLDVQSGEPLETGLAVAAGQWSRDTGLPVQMSLAKLDEDLSPSVKRQFLQIAREALANVAKHASPCNVWIELDHSPIEVTMRIRDDGRGFAPSQPSGHGLDIIRERAAVVGASLRVTSAPGEGTGVLVTCPRDREKGDR